MTSEPARGRGRRLPRSARRNELLESAREAFVAQGYHAAAMDDIADRAGVSKPVLYQHFPSKRELYLDLIAAHAQELIDSVAVALASTTDNKQRVAAALSAYFDFVGSDDEAFRLIYESDLTSDPDVRAAVDRVTSECAELFAEVIMQDTGLPRAEAELLAVALAGMAQVSARYWLRSDRQVPREAVDRLMQQLAWRGVRGFPKDGAPGQVHPGTVG